MLNNNISDMQSRSSRRRTRTLRNTFNIQAKNQLFDLYTNNLEALNKQSKQTIVVNEQNPGNIQKRIQQVVQSQKNMANQNIPILELKADQRDQIIERLKKNNRIINNEVQIIWQKLNKAPENTKKYKKIIDIETNYQKLEKDLKNAYQCIKMTENQINRFKKRENSSFEFIEKLKKLRHEHQDREIIINRLKSQIVLKNKEIKEGQRLILQKINQKDKGGQLKILTQEMNYLFESVKQNQRKQIDRVNVLKNQYVAVKRLQRQLVEKGISEFQLQSMKTKCIKQFPTKKQLQNRIKQINQTKQTSIARQKPKKSSQKQVNRKNLNVMINQIRILQKKKVQFEKEYKGHQDMKIKYSQFNQQLQEKIRQFSIEIQSLQDLNQKLRSKHIQQYRNKQIAKAFNQQKNSRENNKVRRSHKLKLKTQLQNISQNVRYKSLPNSIRNQHQKPLQKLNYAIKKRNYLFGKGSQGCNKFNDKHILGKQHLGKKVVELVLYFQPLLNYICGINLTYQSGIKGGDYIWKTTDNQQLYKIESFQCGEGYIRDIFPQFQRKDNKSQLIGIEIQLSNGDHKKFGKVQNYKKKLSQNQYIGCIYGSMNIIKDEEGLNISCIQQLGLQIYQ